MSRKVTAVVLCEDKQSRAVLYRYLRHERGFERVRVLPLENELKKAGLEPRGRGEPIALVVPRWEMETWLHHYLGRAGVVEDESYPKFRDREAEAARPAVTALVALVDGREAAPANLPAIAVAAEELRRLP